MFLLATLVVVVAILLCAVSAAMQLSAYDFRIVVAALTESGVIRDIVASESDFALIRNAGLLDVSECPMKTAYFECDDQGRIVQLFIAPTLPGIFDVTSLRLLFSLKNLTFEDFEGYVTWPIAVVASVTVRRATLHELKLPAAATLVLENVVFTQLDWTMSLPVIANMVKCDFVNVSLPCPIPAVVAQTCFNRSASTGCWSVPPKIPPPRSLYTKPCIDTSAPCQVTCPPPASGLNCGEFFPLTPGPSNVISQLYTFLSETIELVVTTNGTIGQVSRIELFDWRARTWIVAFDRPMSVRTAGTQENIKLPAILTNRVNVTLEQWPSLGDKVQVALVRSEWPARAPLTPKLPICEEPVTMSSRSMLDETLADSWCIGRVCQRACADALNWTFARPVLPLFLVVDGGELWSGATLVATPSDETRVYSLAMLPDEVSVLRTPGLNPSGVRRARLVGQSATLQDKLIPIVPPRKGMPGVLVKWIESRRAPGASAALNGTSTFDGKAAAPFVADENASVAFAMSYTFVFADGSLWRGERVGSAGTRWTSVSTSGELTRLLVNRGEPPARRVLVGLDDGLLAVVSASVRVHDGSSDRLLTNRLVLQMSIDVLNVKIGAWYGNILQHDIARNLSDIDVVQWNRTRFGVVDRASGRTSVIEYRALPYTLVSCSSNRDCSSCVGNIANDEPCEWCPDTGCKPAFSLCSTRAVRVCPSTTTTTATEGTTIGSTTTAVTTTNRTNTMANATRTQSTLAMTTTMITTMTTTMTANLNPAESDNSSTVGLAVGISVVLALLIAGGIGVWYYVSRVKPSSGGENRVELQATPPTTTVVDSPRSALSREYSDVNEVRNRADTETGE